MCSLRGVKGKMKHVFFQEAKFCFARQTCFVLIWSKTAVSLPGKKLKRIEGL